MLSSIRRLQQFSCGNNIESYSRDLQSLKQRAAVFSEGEIYVALVINKVYTANCVEYQNRTCWLDKRWCMCSNAFNVYCKVCLS